MIRTLSRQLLKVIEWTPSRTDWIVHKFNMESRAEIINGSSLTVREGQVAILCKDGKIADIFAPGRHKLSTANLPVLTSVMSWGKGFRSPFVCDVFFVNTSLLTGNKWGTQNPFTMRDAEFGVIRVRSFGIYNFRVVDPRLVMVNLLGGGADFNADNIVVKLRSIITSNLSNIIASSKYSAIDLATKLQDFSVIARKQLDDGFRTIGFELQLLVVENISFPPEVERVIDSRSSIGVLDGKMGSFVAMQQAQALRDMANNPAGFGGAMMGVGMMGNMGGQNMAMNSAQDEKPPQLKKRAAKAPKCSACKAVLVKGARFCAECGASQASGRCSDCKEKLKPGARFCSGCGGAV